MASVAECLREWEELQDGFQRIQVPGPGGCTERGGGSGVGARPWGAGLRGCWTGVAWGSCGAVGTERCPSGAGGCCWPRGGRDELGRLGRPPSVPAGRGRGAPCNPRERVGRHRHGQGHPRESSADRLRSRRFPLPLHPRGMGRSGRRCGLGAAVPGSGARAALRNALLLHKGRSVHPEIPGVGRKQIPRSAWPKPHLLVADPGATAAPVGAGQGLLSGDVPLEVGVFVTAGSSGSVPTSLPGT